MNLNPYQVTVVYSTAIGNVWSGWSQGTLYRIQEFIAHEMLDIALNPVLFVMYHHFMV